MCTEQPVPSIATRISLMKARKIVRFHGINLRIVYAGMSNNKEPVVLVLNNDPLGCKKLGGSRYSVSVSASE